jgi:hypothetical protein
MLFQYDGIYLQVLHMALQPRSQCGHLHCHEILKSHMYSVVYERFYMTDISD